MLVQAPVTPASPATAAETDLVLRRLGRERAASDHELGRWLLMGFRLRVHELVGFASFREYADRVFGFTGRATEDRVRVAEALEALPRTSAAFRDGALTYSVVRELTRVVTADTEAEWIELTEGKTAREVERLVSGRTKGDRPMDPAKPEAKVHRLSLTLNAESYALLQEARRALSLASGGHLDDDSFAALLAGAALRVGSTDHEAGDERSDPSADGSKSAYQVALTVCPACDATTQRAGSEDVIVDDATVAMARCDSTHVGDVDGPEHERASQTIPPKTRRAVVARHRGRCAVPGCSHTACHVHHLDLRSEGGTHDPERLIALCEAHHRHTHVGRLLIDGTYSQRFRFQHADGTPYGSASTHPAHADLLANVLDALTHMGFRTKEARSLVDAVRPHVGEDATVDEVLRSALRSVSVRGACEELAVYRRLPLAA